MIERYMHDKGEKVQRIAEVIRLFDRPNQCSNTEPGFLADLSSDVARNVAQGAKSNI